MERKDHFDQSMVKPLREKLGLTQQDFGVAINAGTRTVAGWESGKIVKISRAIRMNLIALKKRTDKNV